MEEVLKQILTEIQEFKVNQLKTDQRVEALSDRIEANDKIYKSEFKKLGKRLDSISEVVAKTMEDVTEIKGKIEKHDNDLKILRA